MKSYVRVLTLAAAAAIVAPLSTAAEMTARDFARWGGFKEVKVSPTGEYIAATVPTGVETNLAVIRLADMKIIGGARAGKFMHVYDFSWASPERLIATMAESEGPLEYPHLTGEIMAVNADGSQMTYLFGYRGRQQTTRIGSKDQVGWGFGRIVDAFLDGRHALIAIDRLTSNTLNLVRSEPYKVDLLSGRMVSAGGSPGIGRAYYVADAEGHIRYAVLHSSEKDLVQAFRRRADDGQWQPLGEPGRNPALMPLRVAADGELVYVEATNPTTGRDCLGLMDGTSASVEMLACDPTADVGRITYASDRRTPIAAKFQGAATNDEWIDKEHPEGRLYAAFDNSFENQVVHITSWSADGSKAIVSTYSDRNPGEYFLFDRKTGQAQYLLGVREWIDPNLMSERRSIRFKSRDGTTLYGYLTFPAGREPKNLPLIVNPHGGPFGVRDDWEWDADSQFLAYNGYAVLNVNFRGSSGYGDAYQQAARQGWGTMMIDDITDGLKWAIEQGFVDADRVCIYGASYGGYASLMSAVREPDAYRCVIGYAGVYDLIAMRKSTDFMEQKSGRKYFADYIGDDADTLRRHSPTTYLDKLKAPVFIVHGEEDQRAPFSQAKILRAALEQRHHPYEWLTKSDEGHGFAKEDNRVELYDKMLAFIRKNIGPGAPVAAPTSAP